MVGNEINWKYTINNLSCSLLKKVCRTHSIISVLLIFSITEILKYIFFYSKQIECTILFTKFYVKRIYIKKCRKNVFNSSFVDSMKLFFSLLTANLITSSSDIRIIYSSWIRIIKKCYMTWHGIRWMDVPFFLIKANLIPIEKNNS